MNTNRSLNIWTAVLALVLLGLFCVALVKCHAADLPSTGWSRQWLRNTNADEAWLMLGSGSGAPTGALGYAILKTNGFGYGTTFTNFAFFGNSNGANQTVGALLSVAKIGIGVDLFQRSSQHANVNGGSIVFPDTQGICWDHGDYIRDRNSAHASDGSGSLLEIYGGHGIGLFGDGNIQVGNSTANNANMSMQYNDSEGFGAFSPGYIPRSKLFGFATQVGSAMMQGVGANTNYYGNAAELWFFSGLPPTIGAPTVSGTFGGYNYNRAARTLTNGFEVNGPLRLTDTSYGNTLSLTNAGGALYVASTNGLVVATVSSSSNFLGGVTVITNLVATISGDGSGITNANGWVTAKVTGSDATTTGQALVDVTGLTFTCAADSGYEFEAVLMCTTTAVTTGTEYGIANTGAGSGVGCSFIASGATNAATGATYFVSATNTATQPFLLASGQTGEVVLKGHITTLGGTPTVAVRHLKVTSGTSTVKKGSTFSIRKVY